MQANCFIDSLFSNENNSNSAPALGAGGRGFESRYPDNKKGVTIKRSSFFVVRIRRFNRVFYLAIRTLQKAYKKVN